MKRVALLFLFLFTVLGVRYIFYVKNIKDYAVGQHVRLTITLLDEPKLYQNRQIFQIRNIAVSAPSYRQYHYGDTLEISGIAEASVSRKKSNVTTANTNLIVKNPSLKLMKLPISGILSVMYFIRQKIAETFSLYIPGQEAGLLMGIVFGIKQGINRDFYSSLRNAGLFHVVAASGMNLTMVAGFLEGILLLFLNRYIGLVFIIGTIIFYALLAGLEPSIIRAALMSITAYSASILGRQNYSYISLFTACFIMIFISPDLIGDVGFQLSFFSTLGILSLKPLFSKFRRSYGIHAFGAEEDIETTLSSQIMSFPILLMSFGSYQFFCLFSNILVLWMIPIIMVLGGAGALFALIYQPASSVFIYLCYPFLNLFVRITDLFSSLFQPANIRAIPPIAVIGYYCMLISLVIYFSKKLRC